MAIQTTNPLILLQGKVPDIAPAMNQLLAADLPGIGRRKRENKLMQTKVGSEQMRAKIESAALISESLLPALESGDMASATKLLNDVKNIDPELANEGLTLLQSDPEKLKTLSRQAIDTYKRIQAQGGQNIVGSPFKLESGNMGYLSKTGEVVDTGKPFYNEYKNVNIGDVPSVFNPKTGQFSPAQVSDKPVTAGDVAANRAEIAGAETEAKKTAELGANQQFDAPAAFQAAEYSISEIDSFANDAKKLLDHPGLESATGFGGEQLSKIAGTPAADAAAMLETMKSKSFISALSSMRAASKTGGAVGNVSDSEGRKFENKFVALQQSQSTEQFKSNLRQLISQLEDSKKRIKDAYKQQYGNVKGARMFDEQMGGTQDDGGFKVLRIRDN